MEPEMLQPPPQVCIKPELDTAVGGVDSSKTLTPPRKLVILADLNANPPESGDPDSLLLPAPDLTGLTNDESSQEKSTVIPKDNDAVEGAVKKSNKKCRSRISKADALLDCGADADGDQPSQWAPSYREEKVSSLKTVSPISSFFDIV
ncbi:hypothetical protein HRI_001545200 [Hibiscus trionum]|uniref:Uncharacterized protein n=1 Tax=Hibiscus trionum TaxID=183268 RepID=A0A9W7HJX0_HIBTR|nr:hypothetical protein HRI_001545200 [Hibiscus trionum]